jgi:hypothetical protein
MATTPEQKLADQIANAVEDHYFNPASIGRMLANQPTYTIDRIMELVLWIIEKQAKRHEVELEKNGTTSESLWLAHELDKLIDNYKKEYIFDNIKIP